MASSAVSLTGTFWAETRERAVASIIIGYTTLFQNIDVIIPNFSAKLFSIDGDNRDFGHD